MRRVLRTPAAAEYIGYTPSTLEKKRVYGGGPRFVKLGERAVGYDIEDLDSFIEERRRVSTSDPGETVRQATAPPAAPVETSKQQPKRKAQLGHATVPAAAAAGRDHLEPLKAPVRARKRDRPKRRDEQAAADTS
jgi:predicted DNA-binding transcriptional regulator AlpA